MLFTIGAVILFVIALVCAVGAMASFLDEEVAVAVVALVICVVCAGVGLWLQTHRIVNTQHVGISRSTFSQELRGLHNPGMRKKPFFGSMHQYPASSNYERCERYTPAIKGSYGINIDLCFYYDVGNVDWLKEVNLTGSLDAGRIMNVWRNSVVGDVAKSVKEYTPEALSDNRAEVERTIFENVSPWFNERGVPLARVSFKNWDFTSAEVAQSFDASIVSQRKITEQTALFEAAKISREREKYEAETSKLVAEWQKEALDVLGFEDKYAVEYLWIKMLSEQDKAPDVLILGADTPVAIPVSKAEPATDAK
jgi:hypothetical protein